MTSRLTGMVLALTLLATPALADNTADAAQALAGAFASFDKNGDGVISPLEGQSFINRSFEALDTAKDGKITKEEFRQFNLGIADIADKDGKTASYVKAHDAIFARWDAKSKGYLTKGDYSMGVGSELAAAVPEDSGTIKLDAAHFASVRFVAEMIASIQ